MEIPSTAKLTANGCEISPASKYLIDREGNVYIYLEELDTAVESEHIFVYDEYGEQVGFSYENARRLPVISVEEALEQLNKRR